MFCSYCGTDAPSDASFCRKCGQLIQREPGPLACPSCHTGNLGNAVFCQNCGVQLNEEVDISRLNKQISISQSTTILPGQLFPQSAEAGLHQGEAQPSDLGQFATQGQAPTGGLGQITPYGGPPAGGSGIFPAQGSPGQFAAQGQAPTGGLGQFTRSRPPAGAPQQRHMRRNLLVGLGAVLGGGLLGGYWLLNKL